MSCLAGKRRVAIRCGKTGSPEPAINRSARAARMRPGTVEPTGVIASSPKHSRIVPSERPCKLDVSQPTVTYPEGTRDKTSCSTREVGAQSFVSIGMSCARIAAWCPEFLLRRTWPRWITSHVDLRSPTMSAFAWDRGMEHRIVPILSAAFGAKRTCRERQEATHSGHSRIEIPQCSRLQHRRVCYASETRETLDSETARVHHAAQQRGGVAARGTRAAARDAGDRVPPQYVAH